MRGREALKDVPNIVWVCLTIIVAAVLLSFTTLIAMGKPTTELTNLVQSFFQVAGLIVGGGGAAFAASAAVNAKRAAKNTETTDEENGGTDA